MEPVKDGEADEIIEVPIETLERTSSGRTRRTEVQQLNGEILAQTLRPRKGHNNSK